jgi:hypothetical protein
MSAWCHKPTLARGVAAKIIAQFLAVFEWTDMGIVGGLVEICAAMNPALANTSQVLASTVLAFVLGGYSSVLLGACSEVKGSTATWVVIVCCIVGIAVSVFALMRDAWRSR